MADLELDLAQLKPEQRYKVMGSIIIPRPIAFVTTLGPGGLVNAAPYSYFNVFSEDPPLIVLGLHKKPDGTAKDTTRNIHETGEFVVNLVDEPLAEKMDLAAVDFPPDVSETTELDLALAPSRKIKTPRLKAAPFAIECRREVALSFSAERVLLVGQALHVHARDGLIDPKTLRVDWESYRPVGRIFGPYYSYQRNIFELKRPSYAEWAASRKKK